MTTMNPYLTFKGNTEEAFTFYKSVFGGEYMSFMRFSEMPKNDDACAGLSETDMQKVMHVSLPISDDHILMGSDTVETNDQDTIIGNNFNICLNADSQEDADRLFAGLSAGGTVIMPMDNTFWGSYFGMCKDAFGIGWMISFDTLHDE
ncbi:VOC family protein [Marinicella sp. W31]|uniref:VOC family protein n=1 Tax=Marinicella sp. W31 TaxID=3023713 RepID=UPI003757A138